MRDCVYLFQLIIAVQSGIRVWRHTDVVHIILTDLSAWLFRILPHMHTDNKDSENKNKKSIYQPSLAITGRLWGNMLVYQLGRK